MATIVRKGFTSPQKNVKNLRAFKGSISNPSSIQTLPNRDTKGNTLRQVSDTVLVSSSGELVQVTDKGSFGERLRRERYNKETTRAAREGTANYQTKDMKYGNVTYTLEKNNLNSQLTKRNNVNDFSSNNSRAVSFSKANNEESKRLQVTRKIADFATKYDEGYKKRISNLDKYFSKLSGGGGTSLDKRSTKGKIAQTTIGTGILLAQGSVLSPIVLGDSAIMAGTKAIAFGAGLSTKETRQEATKELFNPTKEVIKTYKDPYTVVPALLAGGLYGRARYKSLEQKKLDAQKNINEVKASTGIIDTMTVDKNSISLKGKMYDNVQGEPKATFSLRGEKALESGKVAVDIEVQQPTYVHFPGFKPLRTGNKKYNYQGTYNPKSGQLDIIGGKNNVKEYVVTTKPGKSRPLSGSFVIDERTARSTGVLLKSNDQGVFLVEKKISSRGISSQGVYNKYPLSNTKVYNFYLRDEKSGLLKVRNRGSTSFLRLSKSPDKKFYGESTRVMKDVSIGGAESRRINSAFYNLRRAGFYTRPQFNKSSQFNFRLGKRGQISFNKNSQDFTPRQDFRTRQDILFKNPQVTLPLESSVKQVSIFKNLNKFYPRQDFTPRQDFRTKQEFRTRQDFTPRQEFAPRQDFAPRQEFAPRQDFAPRQEFAPRQDFAPRQEFRTRQDFAPRQDFPPKLPPSSPPPKIEKPPPFIPLIGFPDLPSFGLSGSSKKYSSIRLKQDFNYTPSITAYRFNVRGKKLRGRLTGLEIRPIHVDGVVWMNK